MTAVVACERWPLICCRLMTQIDPNSLPRLTALPRSVFQGRQAIDRSILFLSIVAGRHIAPYDRSDVAKEIKPSRDPRGRVARNLRLSLIMINDMYRLSAASPGVPLCEWALVAYMILHANLTSNTGSARVGRLPLAHASCESERKGSCPHPLRNPGECFQAGPHPRWVAGCFDEECEKRSPGLSHV